MKLIIVESPTKAKTISKFLGKGYKVESSYGHVRDLPKSRFAIDLENDFNPEYIIPIKARKRVTELRAVAAKAKEIILASDEDREGEAISWHLKKILAGDGSKTKKGSVSVIEDKPVTRIVFHEITKDAIEHALLNPRELDEDMVNAQQARRILDRIVGYKLSPFLWKKIAKGLSAGRVQSVALRLIVDRENEIKAFKPEEYWSVSGIFSSGSESFPAGLKEISGKSLDKFAFRKKEDVDALLDNLNKASYLVKSIKKSPLKRNPSAPFITSTLQQTASGKLRFSAKKTMVIAQQLYEHGHITYMRTDSTNLSASSTTEAKNWIMENLGKEYALERPRIYAKKSKGAQEAHEAIRPTTAKTSSDIGLTDKDQIKLYDLIRARFLASQMPSAEFESTVLLIEGDETYGFRVNGSRLVFDGYLRVYPQSFEESQVPKLNEGDKLTLDKLLPEQHFTEPPPRYSEAKLIKPLEEAGIGRPSTYVPIISVLQSRNYVQKDAGRFFPTEIGEMVNTMLTTHFPDIVDIKFTAYLETSLDKIAVGELKWQDVLHGFYDPFNVLLEKKYIEVEKQIEDEVSDEVCEKCGKPMIIKFGRFGKFLACSGFPECKNAKNFGKNKPETTGLKCPKCDTGEIIKRRARKGRKRIFWGCDKYPDCDYASWDDPTKEEEPKS